MALVVIAPLQALVFQLVLQLQSPWVLAVQVEQQAEHAAVVVKHQLFHQLTHQVAVVVVDTTQLTQVVLVVQVEAAVALVHQPAVQEMRAVTHLLKDLQVQQVKAVMALAQAAVQLQQV